MNTQTATPPTTEAFPFPKSTGSAAEAVQEPAAQNDAPESAAAEVKPAKPAKTKAVKKAPKAPAAQSDAPESAAVAPTVEVKPAKTKAVKKAPKAPAESTAETKAKRPKKPKVVRDSFTMPKQDYEKIAVLKQKCLEAGVAVKKSEILRAGLIMLEAAATKRLLAAVEAVETVKTGRPAKS
ncbi:hypothetical protein [Burkholderia sp. Ac-20353]|uniref:hypothetical protein n=1 Tax=Burkholderia sp. Ac-20353 TaxID=2703894 RepID=UPI00197C05D9|nr:hypothetical protein [Burkholderia sp. Ac-20353]MBN3787858.1 hypothetical protein [Burkholderia sp. Ac-20353]